MVGTPTAKHAYDDRYQDTRAAVTILKPPARSKRLWMLLKSTSGGGQAIGTPELDAGSNPVLDACATFGRFGVTWHRYRSIWGTRRARIDAGRLGTSLAIGSAAAALAA